jgi:hypothetical protein
VNTARHVVFPLEGFNASRQRTRGATAVSLSGDAADELRRY